MVLETVAPVLARDLFPDRLDAVTPEHPAVGFQWQKVWRGGCGALSVDEGNVRGH